jgi:hypothetical protein
MSRLGRAVERACEREGDLAAAYAAVSERHADEPDVFHLSGMFAGNAEELASKLRPLAERDGDDRGGAEAFEPAESLLSDLSRLFVLAQECWIDATILRQGALAERDEELLEVADDCLQATAGQTKWLRTKIKTTAPQWLTVE